MRSWLLYACIPLAGQVALERKKAAERDQERESEHAESSATLEQDRCVREQEYEEKLSSLLLFTDTLDRDLNNSMDENTSLKKDVRRLEAALGALLEERTAERDILERQRESDEASNSMRVRSETTPCVAADCILYARNGRFKGVSTSRSGRTSFEEKRACMQRLSSIGRPRILHWRPRIRS
jgi:hypothetical protein